MSKALLGVALFVGGFGQALAGATNSAAFFVAVPTLDDAGLAILTVVVGIAAGIAVRRRKKK